MKRIWSVLLAGLTAFLLCAFTGCKEERKSGVKYEITAKYEPTNDTLAGAVKVTFENREDTAFDCLKFQLYPNAYKKDALYKPVPKDFASNAYYAGESYGEIVVSSVSGVKNWEVAGEDENILCAELAEPLYTGDKAVLDIAFTLKLAKVNHRTGVTKRTVNFGNFFPVLCAVKNGAFSETVYYSDGDPFVSECFDATMSLTAPKEYVLATTGTVTEARTLESKTEHTVSATNVRDFAFILSDSYKTLETQSGGKKIAYYYYDDETPSDTLALAKEAFAYFEKSFGAYPYPVYTVAQTGFCYGGMEYPSLTFLSDSLGAEEKVRAVVHETAHQWWYATVGSDQIENAWQDEGLAEYSALCFFESAPKYGVSRETEVMNALKEYRSYYDVYGSVLGRADTKMHKHLKEFISTYEYTCIAYDKPVVMFDTLRKSVGDKKFFAGLKKYYSACKFKLATPEDLCGCFEKTGLDVSGFFESFIQGKAIL